MKHFTVPEFTARFIKNYGKPVSRKDKTKSGAFIILIIRIKCVVAYLYYEEFRKTFQHK